MVVIIVARELAITGLRLLAASKNVVLAAEKFGKHKTISQIVAIIALLVDGRRNEWPVVAKNFCGWMPVFAEIMLWITVALTVSSGPDLSVAQPRALFERRLKSRKNFFARAKISVVRRQRQSVAGIGGLINGGRQAGQRIAVW